MMGVKTEYDNRKLDLESHYELLSFVNTVAGFGDTIVNHNSSSNSLVVTTNIQQCLRAQCVMILYNLIESTMSQCIQTVFDCVIDEDLSFFDLTDNLQKIWIDLKFPSNLGVDKVRERVKTCLCYDKAVEIELLQGFLGGISGNLDLKKIRSLTNALGVSVDRIPDREKTGNILLYIKNTRNKLAHGESSFSNVGSSLVLSDLQEYKKNIVDFLDHVILTFEEFVSKKQYKKTDIF